MNDTILLEDRNLRRMKNRSLIMATLKQTLFAVPMRCDACVKDVSDTLYKLGGITKVEANLKDQLVLVEGTGTHAA